MKALAINGSPRPKGNTEILLTKVLEPLQAEGWDTEYLRIGGKAVRGCMACMQCKKRQNGKCAIDDPMNDFIEKMFAADAIILGSPTYFGNVTTEMKALIDRAGYVAGANGGVFSGKIGVAVVAARRGGAVHTFESINHLFSISSMITPGSLYWNLGHGREKGEVLDDGEALRNMDHLGRAIAWLGKGLQAAAQFAPYPHRNVQLNPSRK